MLVLVKEDVGLVLNMLLKPIMEKLRIFLLRLKVLLPMMNGDTIGKWNVSKSTNTIGKWKNITTHWKRKENKMAFLAVDGDRAEWIYEAKPTRQSYKDVWRCEGEFDSMIELPKGSIRKLIGRELTWENEPVELRGE